MKDYIALIDSGVGGLSVLSFLLKEMPAKHYIYFADTANLPYGNKTKDQLLKITLSNVAHLTSMYNVTTIIFACNTLGSLVFDDVKAAFPNVKFFAISPTLSLSKVPVESKSLILGTSATINRLTQFLSTKDNFSTVLCKMPRLATKIEKYLPNTAKIVPYIKNKLSRFKNGHFDFLILGCTHYNLLTREFALILPRVEILTGVEALGEQVLNYFSSQDEAGFKVKKKCACNLSDIGGNNLVKNKGHKPNDFAKDFSNVKFLFGDRSIAKRYKNILKEFLSTSF